jgi:hypothetical protein
MDTGRTEALVGVRDILKYSDPDIAEENGNGADTAYYYNILALPGISDFYQHPMGIAVVADSEEVCDQALNLIEIKWEERPFILEMEDSAKPDAPKIMSEVVRQSRGAQESNIVMADKRDIGDVEKGFAEADQIIESTIKRAMNSPAGLAMVCVAQWHEDFRPRVHDRKSRHLSANPVYGLCVPSEETHHRWHSHTGRNQFDILQGSFGHLWLAYRLCLFELQRFCRKSQRPGWFV